MKQAVSMRGNPGTHGFVRSTTLLAATACAISVGCGGPAHRSIPRTNAAEPHFLPFAGRVTTSDGAPVAGAGILESCVRPFAKQCARTLVGYRSGPEGRFVDHNLLYPGVYRVTAHKDGYIGRPVILTITREKRPFVHLILDRL